MLATLFTSFLSIKLVRLADRTEERVLPVPVSFILDEQVYEASDPLEKNESPIKENDVQESLTVNGAVQKPKNKKRTGNGNTVMKVDDLFVKKSKG